MKIENVRDFGKALRNGPYTSVGSYPVFFLTSDGGTLSFATAWEERSRIVESIKEKLNDGWRVVAADVNWESELYDDHSGNRIESAYAEDDLEGEVDPIPESYQKWSVRMLKSDTLLLYYQRHKREGDTKRAKWAEDELRRRGEKVWS